MRRGAIALLVLLLLGSACSDGYRLELDQAQRDSLVIGGANLTGRTDLDADDWYEIVNEACSNDPDSEETRTSLVAEWELDRGMATEDAAFALWLIAIQVCRERYPDEHQLPEDHPARND